MKRELMELVVQQLTPEQRLDWLRVTGPTFVRQQHQRGVGLAACV